MQRSLVVSVSLGAIGLGCGGSRGGPADAVTSGSADAPAAGDAAGDAAGSGVVTFDGRFTTLGSFANDVPPPPWPASEDVGSDSGIVVYNASTAQPGWPAPYAWSTMAAAFTSVNDSTHATVRTQVHGAQHPAESDFYASFVFYVPSSLPSADFPPTGFFLVQENFGTPFNGSPASSFILVRSGGVVNLSYTAGFGPALTSTPLPFDQWVRVVEHLHLSTTGQTGLAEVWVDGVKQQFIALPRTGPQQEIEYDTSVQSLSPDGQTAHIATMLNDSTGHDEYYINNYRTGSGSPFGNGSVTIFSGGAKVGTSYAAVDPG